MEYVIVSAGIMAINLVAYVFAEFDIFKKKEAKNAVR